MNEWVAWEAERVAEDLYSEIRASATVYEACTAGFLRLLYRCDLRTSSLGVKDENESEIKKQNSKAPELPRQ